eukprot:1158483-Pelagomonas_calceolata.AAC.2
MGPGKPPGCACGTQPPQQDVQGTSKQQWPVRPDMFCNYFSSLMTAIAFRTCHSRPHFAGKHMHNDI